MPPQADASGYPYASLPSFSLLTFNVFIGSPIPRVRTFTPGLHKSDRLQLQTKALTQGGFDVVCLQELHNDAVLEAYRLAFRPTHELHAGFSFNLRGRLAAQALNGLAAAVAWVVLYSAMVLASMVVAVCVAAAATAYTALQLEAVQPPLPISDLSARLAAKSAGITAPAWVAEIGATVFANQHVPCVVVPLVVLYAFAARVLAGSAFLSFLSGTGHGGLAIAYRRSLFRQLGAWTHTFDAQTHDWLDPWRPRAFQVVLLEPCTPVLQGGRHAVCVVNVHMCLEDETVRSAQVAQAVAFAEGPEVRSAARGLPVTVVLCGDTNALEHAPSMVALSTPQEEGGHGYTDAFAAVGSGERLTWSARNPLTHGYLVEPDGRLDYVFLRGPLPPSSAPGACATPQALSPEGRLPCVVPSACSVMFNHAPFLSDHFGVMARLSVVEAQPDAAATLGWAPILGHHVEKGPVMFRYPDGREESVDHAIALSLQQLRKAALPSSLLPCGTLGHLTADHIYSSGASSVRDRDPESVPNSPVASLSRSIETDARRGASEPQTTRRCRRRSESESGFCDDSSPGLRPQIAVEGHSFTDGRRRRVSRSLSCTSAHSAKDNVLFRV